MFFLGMLYRLIFFLTVYKAFLTSLSTGVYFHTEVAAGVTGVAAGVTGVAAGATGVAAGVTGIT